MRIEVVRKDGMSTALDGWRFSRHDGAADDWREVAPIDVPVNELPSAILLVRDATILEREVIASMRNHVMWARTSHVDDPTAFAVPSDLATRSNEMNRARMVSERAAGLSQDEWRRHLPVTSTTAFAMRISFRDLVKLTEYFIYLAGQAMSEISAHLRRSADALRGVVRAFVGDDPTPVYQPIRLLHEGTIDASVRTAHHGEFIFSTLTVPLWMRAQIVRHRPLTIVDTFFRDVIQSHQILDLTIERPIRVQMVASAAYWRTILSKRTCWLAQDSLATKRDLWQAIVDGYGFGPELLPCADGRCPYGGDAALRVSGADPGVPCPRYMNIYGIDKAGHRDAMRTAARSRHSYWLKEIER